jgi:hypothetical protein
MNQPIIYQIRINEPLDDQWIAWFAPLVIQNEPKDEATLTGLVCNQAELFGLLTLIGTAVMAGVAALSTQPVGRTSAAAGSVSDQRLFCCQVELIPVRNSLF